jgi:hypothetical protein
MSRRHMRMLSLWIVPLLIMRALIPTGFMLSADGGQLQLTFCPAGIYQLPSQQDPAHAGHDSGQGHEGHDSGGTDGTACPFSLAASAIIGDVPSLPAGTAAAREEVFDFVSASSAGVGPIRTDRIRGPPLIS